MKSAITTVASLSEAVGKATRSANFCVSGCLPAVDAGLEVEGMGAVKLPLKRAAAKELVERCRPAPYGKGTQTLVNKRVRNTFELDPKKFRLSEAWSAAVAQTTELAAQQLGLPAGQLEARLYKLLVYEKGGFFLPHRDSEKHDRMVASLIVVLPSRHEGGALIVRHGAVEQMLAFPEAAAGGAPCYAAFYADCEHEVQRVTRGVRVCLAYNLVLKQKPRKRKTKPDAPGGELADTLRSWIAARPATPLVFALEHHYTERGLSLELLKGADRKLAELVAPAAEQSGCRLHLAQVSRHLLQFADDGSFARGYRYRNYGAPRGPIEIGETYEDDLHAAQWADARGKNQPWGEIPLDVSAIVSATPINDWKPTREEFEGYTGNAGNSLDRWYHRSALVVWHRDHHYEVIASSGAGASIPLFCRMTASLAKTPKKRLEDARNDCLRFARAIIDRWPREVGYGYPAGRETSREGDFPKHLLMLHDRDIIATFLSMLAERDRTLRLKSFIVAACREFGGSAFADELKQLLHARPDRYGRDDVASRDVEWLAAFCSDKKADSDQTALAKELCALVVDRFCRRREPERWRYGAQYRREASASETSLPLLLKAVIASGCEEELSRVIRHVQESPDEFRLEECQTPCLKSLIPWSQKRLGRIPPQLASWLNGVREHLESATAEEPAPPRDWTRPAEVSCNCPFCAQLNAFLADPESEVGRIPAREDRRQHLVQMINQHQCDVKHALERKGSPHSLVLTKTTGAHRRAVEQYKTNRRLLRELPPPC